MQVSVRGGGVGEGGVFRVTGGGDVCRGLDKTGMSWVHPWRVGDGRQDWGGEGGCVTGGGMGRKRYATGMFAG